MFGEPVFDTIESVRGPIKVLSIASLAWVGMMGIWITAGAGSLEWGLDPDSQKHVGILIVLQLTMLFLLLSVAYLGMRHRYLRGATREDKLPEDPVRVLFIAAIAAMCAILLMSMLHWTVYSDYLSEDREDILSVMMIGMGWVTIFMATLTIVQKARHGTY